jgi:hypothetical protein
VAYNYISMGSEASRVNMRYVSALEEIGGPNTANTSSHITCFHPSTTFGGLYQSDANRIAHEKEYEAAKKAREEYYARQKK